MPTPAETIDALRRRGLKLAVAESMTGGLLGARLTEVVGASEVFVGGFITYVDAVKRDVLGVDGDLLAKVGAVSPEVAREMAMRARDLCGADVGLSVTGIAGPNAPDELPVGLVYLGVAHPRGASVVERRYEGDRDAVRRQAVEDALGLALVVAEETEKE